MLVVRSVTIGLELTPPATVTAQHGAPGLARVAAPVPACPSVLVAMEPSQQDISIMQEWRTSVNPEFATRRNRARVRPIARICRREMNMLRM